MGNSRCCPCTMLFEPGNSKARSASQVVILSRSRNRHRYALLESSWSRYSELVLIKHALHAITMTMTMTRTMTKREKETSQTRRPVRTSGPTFPPPAPLSVFAALFPTLAAVVILSRSRNRDHYALLESPWSRYSELVLIKH